MRTMAEVEKELIWAILEQEQSGPSKGWMSGRTQLALYAYHRVAEAIARDQTRDKARIDFEVAEASEAYSRVLSAVGFVQSGDLGRAWARVEHKLSTRRKAQEPPTRDYPLWEPNDVREAIRDISLRVNELEIKSRHPSM
jgi:hypothetical protein